MNNLNRWRISFVVVLILAVGTGFGWYLKSASQVTAVSSSNDIVKAEDVDMTEFWKAWKILDSKHVSSASTSVQQRVWGAVEGLASSYGDDYTVFMPPSEAKSFNDEISGSLEGVGMEVGIRDGMLTVISPIKDSPAEKADIRAGDKIIEVNGKKTEGMSVDEAVSNIRGAKGTKATLLLLRKGASELITKEITRDVIKVPTIKTEIKNGKNDKDSVFVISLYSFNAQSPSLFRKALREFIESGTNKLILDLRNNPGGYLDAATDMANFFLPVGAVIVTEDYGGKGKNDEYKSKGYNIFDPKNQSMLILVNEGSASASEILAGALQEHGIAKLIGTKTFGKGSVQELVRITPDTYLKVTVARWLTPLGHNISKEGITPDIIASSTPRVAPATDKNGKTEAVTEPLVEKDAQMDKALEIIRKLR